MTKTDSDAARARCPECDANEVYHRRTSANGGYGPMLLHGLGRLFSPAKMDVYICAECGFMRFFAGEEARENVRTTDTWRKL